MFEGQPKGLYALALANTGERFGYYTIVMFVGYVLLSIPTAASGAGKAMMFGSLALIACGTGLFKGNLQVMVGNLYDAPEYKDKRDTAFSLFYMAINIGALFAPTAATKVTNYVLGMSNLTYNGQIPALAHQYLDNPSGMTTQALANLEALKEAQGFAGDTAAFCTTYIDKLAEAYNYGFAVACVSLIVSFLIYWGTFSCRNKTENHSSLSCVCSGNLLLDGIPSEWSYSYILCARLY